MNEKRRVIMFIILAAMVAALIGVSGYYWYNNTYFVSTEDARVTGDLIKINPQVSGKLLEFSVEEGDKVSKDQILGRQEMANSSDSNIEQSIIRAPISGIIIKKAANIGEIQSSGQTLAIIVDTKKLYITANIEETKLIKVKPGQSVDIIIDQFQGEKFTGKVKYVGQASNSAFSLLATSTSSTFTKVVQRIPVRIEFDKKYEQLLPGTNAVVKIHVK